MSLESIGASIRRARLVKGLTQAQLADLTGLSRTTINQVERGRVADLGIRKIVAVADRVGLVVGVSPAARPMSPDPFRIACVSSSVSFRERLREDELIRTLATGKAPRGRRPHLRALLDEVPAVVLQQLLVRLGATAKLARNVRTLAADLHCSRNPDSWLTDA